MRLFSTLCLYTALVMGANAAAAQVVDPALLTGDMKKLVVASAPKDLPDVTYTTADGSDARLMDHTGKVLLVNFWATWCAPCRHEMPMLSALQTEFGGDDFQVVTISTGRDNPAKVARFFGDMGITNLPQNRDEGMRMARKMAVLGLPVVLLIDRQGREIARMTGPATWDSADSRALISALIADQTPSQ